MGLSHDTVVLDVDGTLVDSVYMHVCIWYDALGAVGVRTPAWRIHRAIGMGGDRLVEAVAGARVERALGDQVRALHDEKFARALPHLVPTTGASALLEKLAALPVRVALASSSSREQTADFIAMLEADALIDDWVSGDDVSESKPDPEAVALAVQKVGGTRALVVGDSTWDARAASSAGHAAVGLLSGGISEAELREAGMVAVYEDPQSLSDDLDAILRGSTD